MIIDDVLEHTVDNRGKTPPVTDCGHPLIEINCIAGNKKYPDYTQIRKHVSNNTYMTWFRSGHPLPGDILIPTVGTLDAIAVMDRSDCCIAQNLIALRTNPSICVGGYLYYYLCNPTVRKKLLNLDIGGVQPSIKVPHLKNLKIELPELTIQRKIASFLGCIDEKIEVNNQINDNIEQQLQSLFGQWLSAHMTFATAVTLGEVCSKVTDGSHFSPKDDPSSSIPMFSVKDMGQFDFDFSSCKHISAEDYRTMLANDCVPQVNDILVAKDGSYLKEIFICNELRQIAILSSIAIFRPNLRIILPEVLLALLKSPRILQEVRDNYVSGSALPRIVLKDFKKLQFFLPSVERQHEFVRIAASYRAQIANNMAETTRLLTLRDALLPRLMSGEIDVSGVSL